MQEYCCLLASRSLLYTYNDNKRLFYSVVPITVCRCLFLSRYCSRESGSETQDGLASPFLLTGSCSNTQFSFTCFSAVKSLINGRRWAVTWSVCIFGCVWWLSPESQNEMDDSTFKAFFRRPRWSFSLCVRRHCVLCILCFGGWIRSRTWFAINNNKFHSGLFIHIVPVYNNGHLIALYVVT